MPKILYLEQRSEEWFEIRRGVLSCSNFDKIITPTGKLSAKRFELFGTLLAEHFKLDLGPSVLTYWMRRGIDLEPEARKFYEKEEDVEVEEVGFVFKDPDNFNQMVGGSPDGLVGDDGILEIKVPAPFTHLTYLHTALKEEKVPNNYNPQLQGLLWVCERDWIDFFSYHEKAPNVLLRVEKDPKFQDAFDEHIPTFLKELAEAKKLLEAYFEFQGVEF